MNCIDRKDINEEGVLKEKLNYRPNTAIAFVFCLGLFLIYVRSSVTIILGVLCLILCGIAVFMVKDRTAAEFYDDACILYDPSDQNKALQVKYEDVREWAVDAEKRKLVFILNDNEVIEQETLRYEKAYRILADLLPDKKVKPSFIKNIGKH